jgi:hypothetical protein
MPRRVRFAAALFFGLAGGLLRPNPVNAAPAGDPAAVQFAHAVVAAHGGPEKLLRVFTFTETFLLAGREKGTRRTSTLEPPHLWYVGKKERVKEENKGPICHDVWMWTLQPLADPRSVLAPLPDTVVEGKPARGLRVGGSIEPAMSVYFDATTHDLLKIEWRGEQFHFSTPLAVDGTRVPSRCVLIGKSGKERMRTELHEVTRLAALPPPLAPK